MKTQPAFKPRTPALDTRLQQHFDTLGIATLAGYKRWCHQNGLRTTLDKSPEDLQAECDLAQQMKHHQGPPISKYHRPAQAAQITYIYENQPADIDTKHFLRRYVIAFNTLSDDPDARHALYRLLIHTEKYTGLFEGLKRKRFLIDTFVHLARLHPQWIRPVETWFPSTNDQTESFATFVRHLLARYDVPKFMDKIWFRNPNASDTICFQNWYCHIANGQNIRTASNFSFRFTKRMAHLFLQAPKHYRIEHAIRWAQVKALGGSTELARAVYRTRLGESFQNEDFWFTVIQFFVNNPMLDPTQVGPIVDYIYNQKYVPREIIQPGGGVVQGLPSHPQFTIKGRSADKLLRLVEEWHGDLAAQDYVPFKEWQPTDIRPFKRTETDATGQTRTWTIHELCTSWELALEGKAMRHCVRSYANRCATGKSSIWSTQVQLANNDPQPVMTIAIDNADKRITQHLGKCNLPPHSRTTKRRDIPTDYLDLLNEAPRLMRLWMEREQIKLG